MNCCRAVLSRGSSTTAPDTDVLLAILPSALAPRGTRGALPIWTRTRPAAPADDATVSQPTTTTAANIFRNGNDPPDLHTNTASLKRAPTKHPHGCSHSRAAQWRPPSDSNPH